MDLNSLVTTLLSSDSVNGIGKAAGADSGSVQSVLTAAVPMLLSGAKAQSADQSSGFSNALLTHGKDNTSNLSSFLGSVDLDDGGKIVDHLLGGNSDAIGQISKKAGVSKADTGNILAAAAPLLMSLLGQSSGSGQSNATAATVGALAATLLQNVDVSGLLSSLLGGGSASTATASGKKKKKPAAKKTDSGNLLGDLLGSLFKG